jgi:transcriptional regulator with XRE-family HTH domain
MGTRKKTDATNGPRHYIREWRKFRGLTQEQLAGRLGVVTSSVSQLETGKQGYSQPMLEAIAEALRCEPADLLNMNPLKEGEVIDLMRLLNKAENRDMAIRVLKSMAGD